MAVFMVGVRSLNLGIKLQAIPTKHQRLKLSHWMGCDRFVYTPSVMKITIFAHMRESLARRSRL